MEEIYSVNEKMLVITAIGFAGLAFVMATRPYVPDFWQTYARKTIVTMTIACVASVGLLVESYYHESNLTKLLAPYPGSVLYNIDIDYSNGIRQWMYISPATEEEILAYYTELANRPSRKAERISKYELELYIRDRRFKIRVNTIPFKQLRFLVVEEIRKAS